MIHFSVKVDPDGGWIVVAMPESKDAPSNALARRCLSFGDCLRAAKGFAQKQGEEEYEVEVE